MKVAVKDFPVEVLKSPSEIVNLLIITNAGSCDEDADSYGVAHFLEHMFFKGTTKRHYKDINKISSRLGNINAFTSQRKTCYTLTFLKDDLEEAVELLCEMVFEPAFPEDEFATEKGVIVEEWVSGQDNPSSFHYNSSFEHLMGSQIGHPVIGTKESILDMTTEKIRRFKDKYYNAGNMLISICGDVDENQFYSILDKHLPQTESILNVNNRSPTWDFGTKEFKHPAKQAIVTLMSQGQNINEKVGNKFIQNIFMNAFGGGMHSMLFDRIREELGLCYAVGSGDIAYREYGLNYMYCYLDEANISLCINEMQLLLDSVKKNGIKQDIIDVSKKNYLFQVGKSSETTEKRNSSTQLMFDLDSNFDEYIDFAHRKKLVESITNDDIVHYANDVFHENNPIKLTTLTQIK